MLVNRNGICRQAVMIVELCYNLKLSTLSPTPSEAAFSIMWKYHMIPSPGDTAAVLFRAPSQALGHLSQSDSTLTTEEPLLASSPSGRRLTWTIVSISKINLSYIVNNQTYPICIVIFRHNHTCQHHYTKRSNWNYDPLPHSYTHPLQLWSGQQSVQDCGRERDGGQ